MRRVQLSVPTVGPDGQAVGSVTGPEMPLDGVLHGLRVEWDAKAPATSQITVESEDRPVITYYHGGPVDAWVAPSMDGGLRPWPVLGQLRLTVADCNALDRAVTVWAFVAGA